MTVEAGKDITSEFTKDMTPEQRAGIQEKMRGMSGAELEQFRNGFDPDSMGFFGEEGE